MPGQITTDGRSLADVHSSVATSQVSFWRRMFAFAGPAYLVSVGYMDPGNWATDLEGGARFGYQLALGAGDVERDGHPAADAERAAGHRLAAATWRRPAARRIRGR